MSLADDIRDKLAREQRSAETQAELQTQESRFIAARLPEFWQILTEVVATEVAKFKELPALYHCEAILEGKLLKLHRCSFPFRTIEIRLDVDGRALHVRKADDLDTQGHLERPIRETINVAGQGSVLSFHVHGKTYRTPAELADDFLGFLCK